MNKKLQGNFASSHPSSAERFINIESTIAEIARKKAAGLPLVPERRS
jgi:hypothetical protein